MANMAESTHQAGICSFLDNDLYKINMQCAVFQHFPTVAVEYTFTNRSSHMRLNRRAAAWLEEQINELENLRFTDDELDFLRKECWYLKDDFLQYLRSFQLHPRKQVTLVYHPTDDGDLVDIGINIKGLWVEIIPYEIPLLALVSEAYFKFVDVDWDYDGQEQAAYEKGLRLLTAGCMVSEFGSRRRRDFHTHDLVVQGLLRAAQENPNLPGKLLGTSNVYFSKKYGIPSIGTVAHEWYMCIAAIHDDYEQANELGLQYWLRTWGPNVLGVALTDTFGTPNFFEAFKKPVAGMNGDVHGRSYAEVYTGLRQDSGDPANYVKMAADFYDSVGIKGRQIVFSDGLNVEKCIKYKAIAEDRGFSASFGVGTHLTNDFRLKSDRSKESKPMNIVIKASKAAGRPCVKLSDNLNKNTGDAATIKEVKARLGYAM